VHNDTPRRRADTGAAVFVVIASKKRFSLAAHRRGLLLAAACSVRLRPSGYGATAFARFASESWWAVEGSNL